MSRLTDDEKLWYAERDLAQAERRLEADEREERRLYEEIAARDAALAELHADFAAALRRAEQAERERDELRARLTAMMDESRDEHEFTLWLKDDDTVFADERDIAESLWLAARRTLRERATSPSSDQNSNKEK